MLWRFSDRSDAYKGYGSIRRDNCGTVYFNIQYTGIRMADPIYDHWFTCNIYSTCSNDNRICDFAGILLDRRTDYIWKEGT